MPNSSSAGQYKSKVQHNRKIGVKTAKQHRQQILQDIVEYIHENEGVNYVLLVGDMNKNVYSP